MPSASTRGRLWLICAAIKDSESTSKHKRTAVVAKKAIKKEEENEDL